MRARYAKRLHNGDQVIYLGRPAVVIGDPRVTAAGVFITIVSTVTGYTHDVQHTDIK